MATLLPRALTDAGRPILSRPAEILHAVGHLTSRRLLSNPAALIGDSLHAPPRLNFAGCCVYCGDLGCESPKCLKHHRVAEWEVCHLCDGTGFDKAEQKLCDCYGGLLDMAHSEPCPRPRPSRLTFAGWCIWCLERWCTSAACIERHARSAWMVCPDCGGRGVQEYDICGCFHGLAEA